ncbi:hypothetical protein HY419_01770, partial [candidate division WWE3 bacterium]|nr:hypothetical protein [candidate division WWE3 bacterium]
MRFDKAFQTLKKNILREPWLAISSILVLTLTLLTLNIFVFSIAGSHATLKYLESKAQISIFFLDSMTEERILQIKSDLEKDPRIANVKHISKAEALSIFTEMNKDEPALLESVQSNPLPSSLEVKANDIKDLEKLS